MEVFAETRQEDVATKLEPPATMERLDYRRTN
jgi:hypothetical protein